MGWNKGLDRAYQGIALHSNTFFSEIFCINHTVLLEPRNAIKYALRQHKMTIIAGLKQKIVTDMA
jgi:hypothetical protein